MCHLPNEDSESGEFAPEGDPSSGSSFGFYFCSLRVPVA